MALCFRCTFLCFALPILLCLPHTGPGDGLCRQTLSAVLQWEMEACLHLHICHILYVRKLQANPHSQILGCFFCHGWYWAELSPALSILSLLTNSTFGESIVFPWGTEELVVQKATVPFRNLTFEQDETRNIYLRGQPHFRDKISHSGLLSPL